MFLDSPRNEQRKEAETKWRSALEMLRAGAVPVNPSSAQIIDIVSDIAEQKLDTARQGNFYSVNTGGIRPLGFRGDTRASRTLSEHQDDILALITGVRNLTGNTLTLMRDELYVAYMLVKRIAEHEVVPQSPLYVNAKEIANIKTVDNDSNENFVENTGLTNELMDGILLLPSIDQRILILKQIATAILASGTDWSGTNPFAVYYLTPATYLQTLDETRDAVEVITTSEAVLNSLWMKSDTKRASALAERRRRRRP